MDAQDLKNIEIPPLASDPFIQIWTLQEELIIEYQNIEKLPSYPLQLDLRASQTLLKDFIARVVEELAEADEHGRHSRIQLYKEELADALHFLTETLIFTMSYEEVINRASNLMYLKENIISSCLMSTKVPPTQTHWFWETTYHLKLAANALKNKPWKQTEMRAQSEIFKNHLVEALITFLTGYKTIHMDSLDIFAEYYKKNRINHFRIKSKY